ncbi:Copper chaperone SCO1/SenC [Dillenia turbinata]|uniref:Copper chaperone SCO1/SenC n=1 Tax=Dillenia turbinata TaxID=194707 RepID=A0AAN8Z5N3_9MAGN
MLVSRNMIFCIKNRSAQTLNLLHRFDQSKRIPWSHHVRSARYSTGGSNGHPLVSPPTPSSSSWASYAVPAALLGVVGAAFFVRYNDERRAVPKGEHAQVEQRNVKGPKIGGPFTLINTAGHIVTERDFQGKWVLLYFGYTSSPDVGPQEVQKMAKAIQILETKYKLEILPVFVTIDPQRDNPSQLHAYLKEFDSRINGLTGPVAAIRQMAQEYRVYFKKIEEEGDDYLVESSHNMYLFNPNMEIVRCFGLEYDAEELAKAILSDTKKT